MFNLLQATWEGLGNGEIAIFPIQIFKMKEGVSYNPEDPNYDLWKLACKVSAKRLFPNFSNLDAPFNAQYYQKGNINTEAAYMGCVDASEVVTYKIKDTLYVECIGAAYDKLRDIGEEKIQGISTYIDLEGCNVTIKDSVTGGFVKCKKWIKNPNRGNWMLLKLADGHSLLATDDHPLPIEGKGRTFVRDIVVGDSAFITDAKIVRTSEIVFLEPVDYDGESFDVETESDMFDVSGICSHNCRTRVMGNEYDPSREITTSRGNLSFTSINLPRLALLAGRDNIQGFFKLLDKRLELVKRQLDKRLKLQMQRHVYNYPFLMGQGVWLDSDKLNYLDEVGDILKHGTLTVGFIGLAETLIALTGKHHGESAKSQELGLRIVRHMRDATDRWSREACLNYSVIATPRCGHLC